MKNSALLVSVLLGASCLMPSAHASEPSCPANSSAMTQADMNVCAYQAAEEANNEMLQTLSLAQATVTDDALTALTRAQTAWSTYRDLECGAEADQFTGGSMMPMVLSSCKERLTRLRTSELKTTYLSLN